MLFLIFAVALVLYGAAIAKTGNKDLLPYRAQHSVRNAEDVRRVGRITVVVGLVIGALSLVGIAVGSLAS
ncbi:MAG: hypothetical protein Q4A07_13145 [Coriobacteriales bacterium]|nr:hypothetical protein [Coriobacteriales bacterium]